MTSERDLLAFQTASIGNLANDKRLRQVEHALNDLSDYIDAMTAFPAMADMTSGERADTRRNLLEYCKLDTYAMVKAWEKLIEVSQRA